MRTWQTAHKMKVQRGALPGDSARNDNFRVKRYIAKYTINPAHRPRHRARGRQHRGRQVGRPGALEAGLLRRQARADPEGRLHRGGRDGRPERQHPDAAAGALPADVRQLRRRAGARLAHLHEPGRAGRRPGRAARPAQARGRGARTAAACSKRDMVHNAYTPAMEIDAQTYEVRADGVAAHLRAGDGAADGAALLPVLNGRHPLVAMRPLRIGSGRARVRALASAHAGPAPLRRDCCAGWPAPGHAAGPGTRAADGAADSEAHGDDRAGRHPGARRRRREVHPGGAAAHARWPTRCRRFEQSPDAPGGGAGAAERG